MPEYEVRLTRTYNITAADPAKAADRAKELEYHSPPAFAGTNSPAAPQWLSDLQDSELSISKA